MVFHNQVAEITILHLEGVMISFQMIFDLNFSYLFKYNVEKLLLMCLASKNLDLT